MKLTNDIKKRIDNYFENITSQELYNLAIKSYGFKENININIDNQSFDVVASSVYKSEIDNNIELDMSSSIPLAA
jgi:RNase adaptor protein for sRNA GlmZ degradation